MSIIERNNNEELRLEKPGVCGTPIQRFYAGETIFITGGTGFLGKVLIEKLLRSCPGLSKIYILIRSKKGKDTRARADEMFQDTFWDRLKDEQPHFREKVVPLNGDCGLEGLGLSDQDKITLVQEVSIVFNVAATVRFDEKLELATRINVRSTRDILEICKRMQKLKSFIHVSTIYANCPLKKIDECLYEYSINYEKLIALAETLPEEAFEKEVYKFARPWPNTYVFTKAIAEALVQEKSNGLPIGIFRPAIVTSSASEPAPGWTDNMYGATGLTLAGLVGMLRVINCDGSSAANVVPVDYTVNALIASAWDVYTRTDRRGQSMLLYNYVSSADARIDWSTFTKYNLEASDMYPAGSGLWYHTITLIKNKFLFTVSMWTLHLLPALIVDAISTCIGRKPQLWKMYKKVHKASNVVVYFTLNDWEVTNYNVRKLWHRLDEKDQRLFKFYLKDFNWRKYFHTYVAGIRSYLLKESIDTLPSSRKRSIRLYWLHQAVKTLAVFGVLSLALRIINSFY